MTHNSQHGFYKYFIVITIIMLFLSLGQWPYGYFVFLRWIVTAGAIIMIINAFNKDIVWAKVSFIIISILFNPIAPIHLSREIWIPLDIIVGFIFILGYLKVIK
jgi:hypothetical protein